MDNLINVSNQQRLKNEQEQVEERTLPIPKEDEIVSDTSDEKHEDFPDFVCFNAKGRPSICAPLLADYVKEHLHYIIVRDKARQAKQIFVYENGVYRLLADDMFKAKIKEFITVVDKSLLKMSVVNETFQILMLDTKYVSQDDLNADESIINFKNGLLKVAAGELKLMPHSPDVFTTIQIPCDWPTQPVPTPVFDSFMDTFTNQNEKIRMLLLQVIGLILSNVKAYRTKKALFMVGAGDSGKSVLFRFTEELLGKGNYAAIDLKTLESRFGTGAIYNTRMAGNADMSFAPVREMKNFKMVTGGDSLFAEYKGMQPFEFRYGGFLWFCMNHLPRFTGDNGKWVYDRIIVVDCKNPIPDGKKDSGLVDKMLIERDGIIYKAVVALQELVANGYRFSEPDSVCEARGIYKAKNSPIIGFFNECMCTRENTNFNPRCTTGVVYAAFREWCKRNGIRTDMNRNEFFDELAGYLGSTHAEIIMRRNGNSYYRAYTLLPEAVRTK